MSFDTFIGNKLAISMLRKALETGRIASAYLFHGPDGVGKSLAASQFAKALVCEKRKTDACDVCSACRRVDSGSHPDVHWYRPVGKMRLVKIGDMRELIAQTGLKPFESAWKVFVIVDADRMYDEAQNAVLKTLEEPPGQTVLILISSNPAALLPTIISRCQAVSFLPISRDELRAAISEKWGVSDEEAQLVASLACGSMGAAKRLLDRDNLSRRKILLNLLSAGSKVGFRQVIDAVKAVDDELREMTEGLRRKEEKRIKTMGNALTTDERDAWMEQRNAAIASLVQEEVEDILNLLAFWYRDLLLIKKGVSPDLLTNSDMVEALRDTAAQTTPDEILSRLRALDKARHAVALNVPLTVCLESLFLSGKEAARAV